MESPMLIGPHIKLSSVATLLVVAGGLLVALKGMHGAASEGSAETELAAGRGRDASVPEAIPVKGLRDVFWRVIHEVSDDRVTLIAAGVTFYLLLGLFPSLSALVALYGLIADPATIGDHLRELSGLLPPGAFDLIADRIKSLAESRNSTLGITFFVGFAIASGARTAARWRSSVR
jgi:membrane protein